MVKQQVVPNTPSDTVTTLPSHLFRQAVEQSALAISITDERANILYANAAFQRITGYEHAEIVGHNESILSYRVTPRLVYETLWAQIQRQRPWNGLLVNKRKDGSRYLADVTITPVVGESGSTTHFLGMQRDVTEMHRLERQVQNHKTLIESVVDAAQVAIVLLDEQERVVLDNHEYKKLIGDLGKEPAARILAALRSHLGPIFERAYEKHRSLPAQEICIKLQHPAVRWFSCAVSWFEEQDVGADAFYEPLRHHYLLLTIQDIGELKRQQEEIRINSLRALLAEQERIQGLRETLAGAVYQLEGPLNMLNAVATMLERKTVTDQALPAFSALEESIRRSREALESLRACMPQHAVTEKRSVDLNQLLSDVLKLSTAELLAAGIVVEWHPADMPAEVFGDSTQLSNLFKQLVGNAVDAINERRGGSRELRITVQRLPDCVELRFEDSGPGIADELRYKVFQPFFSTRESSGQHPGLGLAMAQEIVNCHGGVIDIDPEYHTGCRVRVQLPCVPRKNAGENHG